MSRQGDHLGNGSAERPPSTLSTPGRTPIGESGWTRRQWQTKISSCNIVEIAAAVSNAAFASITSSGCSLTPVMSARPRRNLVRA